MKYNANKISQILKNLLLVFLSATLFPFYSCKIFDPQPEYRISSSIYSVNIDGSDAKQLGSGGSFILSQTGDTIFYQDNDSIYCMKTDGTNKHSITRGSYDITLSSGKNKICFFQSGKPYFINTDGSGFTKLNVPDSIPAVFNWDISPSGNKAAFYGTSGMYVMDIDGNNLRLLHKSPDSNNNLYFKVSFTLDGNSLVYSQNQKTIKLLNLSNGSDIVLYPGNTVYPEGSVNFNDVSSLNTVLFSDFNGDVIIGSIDLITNTWSQITTGIDPHYSIDGTRISYSPSSQSGLNTFILPAGPKNHISVDYNLPSNPHLTPDNSKILFRVDANYIVR